MRTIKQIRGTRTRTFFAFFPVSMSYPAPNGSTVKETRWLETVTVQERSVNCEDIGNYWEMIKFID